MKTILELANFQYAYGSIRAVRGVDLYVRGGEMVTLIGANGAGKTTHAAHDLRPDAQAGHRRRHRVHGPRKYRA